MLYRGGVSGRTKLIVAIVLAVAFAVAVVTLPLPGPAGIREWAESTGPAAAWVMLAAYSLCVAMPFPRTAFNLATGLLLGKAVGILVALSATAISGVLGFLLARALGRELVMRYLHVGPVRAVNERLDGGGVLSVASLRLIPVLPFAPMSYCCGVSTLKLPPYVVGTVLGSIPGTTAMVLLGDALTGHWPPELVACYVVFALAGAFGLARVNRKTKTRHTEPEAESEPSVS